MANVGNF